MVYSIKVSGVCLAKDSQNSGSIFVFFLTLMIVCLTKLVLDFYSVRVYGPKWWQIDRERERWRVRSCESACEIWRGLSVRWWSNLISQKTTLCGLLKKRVPWLFFSRANYIWRCLSLPSIRCITRLYRATVIKLEDNTAGTSTTRVLKWQASMI